MSLTTYDCSSITSAHLPSTDCPVPADCTPLHCTALHCNCDCCRASTSSVSGQAGSGHAEPDDETQCTVATERRRGRYASAGRLVWVTTPPCAPFQLHQCAEWCPLQPHRPLSSHTLISPPTSTQAATPTVTPPTSHTYHLQTARRAVFISVLSLCLRDLPCHCRVQYRYSSDQPAVVTTQPLSGNRDNSTNTVASST